jgi:hypothetical protein
MATLKLTIFKAKVLKNGKHKIRIALCHKGETCYILTRYLIDSENQFKNGDQRKNLRSNSDKIVSLPTRIKKEYNGNKRLSSPSSGRNS